jgi:hypothetical protein
MAFKRNISQADLQKVFENKIKRFQTCIDSCGHHLQYILKVHGECPNAVYDLPILRVNQK